MPLRHLLLFSVTLTLCSLIFGQVATPPQNIEIIRNITFVTQGTEPLALDLYLPQRTTVAIPVILALHGGSWITSSRTEMCPFAEVLAAQGYAVVTSDYRLAPLHHYPAQLDDVRAAARWIQANAGEYHFDMQRFHVFGISAGGQLASLLGVCPQPGVPKIASVTAFFSPLDFTAPVPSLKAKVVVEIYLGYTRDERPELYTEASPITHVTPDDPPFLLVHGTKDPFVPYSQSERMADALRKAKVPVVLYPMPGLGHYLPNPNSAQGRELLQTMLRFLSNPSAVEKTDAPKETTLVP